MRKLLVAVLATLMALAPMAAMADPIGFDVGVEKYITATFNYAAVDFGDLAAGSTVTAGGIYNVSVDTNYEYRVSAFGTNFTDGAGHDFSIANLYMCVRGNLAGLAECGWNALPETQGIIRTHETSALSFHGFQIVIPAAQYAGAYTSTVTVSYANEPNE